LRAQTQATLYAVSAVLMWSTVATAFKLTLRSLDTLQLLLWSSLSSVIVLGLVLAGQGGLRALLSSTRKDLARSALMGLLNPFLYYLVLFKAYSLLPAQLAQPLNYTWPIALTLLSIPLLHQKIRPSTILAILISFSGVLVISTEGSISMPSSPLGIGLAIGSSILWALFWILSMRDPREPVSKLFLSFAFGFSYILVLDLATSRLSLPSLRSALGAAYIGVFEMGLTFVLWLKALRLSRTTAHVSVLVYLSPFLSLILIHFVLGERILPSTLIGLVLIVAGIVLAQRGQPRS
jgi:drug/metabolite transporter (DMT)-like permease